MVHFIRNSKNKTIVECEVNNSKKDLSVAFNIDIYSNELLSQPDAQNFIETFDTLSRLRGIWWENYEFQDDKIDEFVSDYFKDIAYKFNYRYITD